MEDVGLIARNVRKRMDAKGIGPKALSLKAGLNETYVRDILKGRSRNPRQAHLQNLALALECRVSDLTGEIGAARTDSAQADEVKRDLLVAFDSLDTRDRETLLRIAQSFKRDDPPTASLPPTKGPEPPAPFSGGRTCRKKAG